MFELGFVLGALLSGLFGSYMAYKYSIGYKFLEWFDKMKNKKIFTES